MNNARNKLKIEELAEELSFWNSYREAYRTKGIDIAQLHTEWAAGQARSLASPGAR